MYTKHYTYKDKSRKITWVGGKIKIGGPIKLRIAKCKKFTGLCSGCSEQNNYNPRE